MRALALLGYALDYISPVACVGCGAPGRWFCRTCLLDLDQPPALTCPGCGTSDAHGQACATCRQLGSPLDQLVVAFSYEQRGLHKLLWAYKERGARHVLPYLATRLRSVAQGLSAECVTFVPATRVRARERGFDQAKLLALEVSTALHVPTMQLLKRVGSGAAQKSLDVLDRRAALRGAYQLAGQPQPGASGIPSTVVLVDDVATTLATLESCAALLKAGGASTVIGLVLAHAQRNAER